MEQCILSVIIAAHNAGDYIEECLASLDESLEKLPEKYTVEAIIINDTSSDNTLEKTNDYKELNFIKRVFSVEFKNVGKVRRFAFTKCSGKYITVLDSDDALSKNSITLIMDYLVSGEYDLIMTPLNEVIDNNKIKQITASLDKIKKLNNSEACTFFLKQKEVQGHLIGKFIKTENLSIMHFPEISCYEDMITTSYAVEKSTVALYINTKIYLYRKRDGSTSHDRDGSKILKMQYVLEQMNNIFKKPESKPMLDALWVKLASDILSRSGGKLKIPEEIKMRVKRINLIAFLMNINIRMSRKKALIKLRIKLNNF
ncbi:glycosyltransferase family 2 protein [Plesiomonas shigelloides]|uniref:glycosyltransferase family 2 protein n=1 Tax=Plesiomonas shigelloides TaxID=703 RepID=UPI003139F271